MIKKFKEQIKEMNKKINYENEEIIFSIDSLVNSIEDDLFVYESLIITTNTLNCAISKINECYNILLKLRTIEENKRENKKLKEELEEILNGGL